jgi:Flp pilus assembly protein TadG
VDFAKTPVLQTVLCYCCHARLNKEGKMLRHRRITGRGSSQLLRRCGEDSGAELVEAAFALPLLLTLLLGIFWMGRAYDIYETITRAAREGVRYAVLPSCASCSPANQVTDVYTAAGTTASPACIGSIGNSTYEFTNYVAPSLLASSLDPNNQVLQQTYCQQAVVMNPTSPAAAQECGIQISFKYPVLFAIPFTSLNATTIDIPTSVTMRMENQPFDSSTGLPTCP